MEKICQIRRPQLADAVKCREFNFLSTRKGQIDAAVVLVGPRIHEDMFDDREVTIGVDGWSTAETDRGVHAKSARPSADPRLFGIPVTGFAICAIVPLLLYFCPTYA